MWLLPLVWTGLSSPANAQIITVPPPAGLSGETTITPPPGPAIVIYHVGLLGLLNKARLEQIELRISPLASPLAAPLEDGDIKNLRLVESANHIFGDADDVELNKVQKKDIDLSGGVTIIPDKKGKATPVGLFPLPVGELLRHYFIVAEIAPNVPDGHAFRVGAAVGHIKVTTPANIGLPVWASNSDRVVVGSLEPVIGVNVSSLDFGTVSVGSDSTRPIQITNTGAANLTISQVNSTDARFGSSPTSLVVVPAATGSLDITYTPNVAGTHGATLSLDHNGPDTPTSLTLSGSGTGGVTPPQILAQPNSHEYDPVLINTTDTLHVQISNAGAATAQISNVIVSNTQFAVTPVSFTLAPGQVQDLSVIHRPTLLGPITGKVSVHVVGLSNPVPILLSGFGASPGLTVAATDIDFGNISYSERGQARLQLTNQSDLPIDVTDISTGDAQFTHDIDQVVVGAWETIDLVLGFQASSLGTKTTTLSVRHEAALAPITVALRADATVALKNSSLSFGRTDPGRTAWLPVTIENPSGSDVTITSIISDNPRFVPDCNTCVIPANGSVDVLVAFTPLDYSQQSAQLSITHNPTIFVGIVGNNYPRQTSPGIDASGEPLETLQVPFGGEWLASLLICFYALIRRRLS